MLKVLFVCDPVCTSNPYVSTLVNGLQQQDVAASMSCDEFWRNDDYDIIHFQWPEAIYKWAKIVSSNQVEQLKERIITLKQSGKRIAMTCHNLQPHTNRDKGVSDLYHVVYDASDLIFHMGDYSCRLLASQYPNAKHVVVPHHIYDDIYQFNCDKYECQQQLGVNGAKINILCFGEFRSDEEREFLVKLRASIVDNNIDFLTPGFFRRHWYAKSVRETYNRVRKIVRYKRMGFMFKSEILDNATTEKYFIACDIVMLQRLSILNSGNLPMGFHAGKVVVGVDVGNVGSILKETGNPTFASGDVESAKNAILKAIELNKQGLGERNQMLAEREWSTNIIAIKLRDEYLRLININS